MDIGKLTIMEISKRQNVEYHSSELDQDIDRIKVQKSGGELSSFWGVGPASPLHFGYDRLILTIKKYSGVGFAPTILIADANTKASHGLSSESIELRSRYYKEYFENSCNLVAKYKLTSSVIGSSDYMNRLLDMSTRISLNKLLNALPKSAKKNSRDTIQVSSLYLLLMQCLDISVMSPDIVIADEGQKKIYDLICHLEDERKLFDIDSKFVYVPNSVDIRGFPLHKSNAGSRLTIHETDDSLKQKIKSMYAPPGSQVLSPEKENALLYYFKYSVFPWIDDEIIVETMRGKRKYIYFHDLEEDYLKNLLHPGDLKNALYHYLKIRIRYIDKTMCSSTTMWLDKKRTIGTAA